MGNLEVRLLLLDEDCAKDSVQKQPGFPKLDEALRAWVRCKSGNSASGRGRYLALSASQSAVSSQDMSSLPPIAVSPRIRVRKRLASFL